MYVDRGWGNINLAPWQIFTDKHHIREVVKDYAIQCGFDFLVERANNKVYVVACLDAGCGWRLHASRLPECTTWAIKKIDNPEHNCRALETHNSLVTIKWAATKLMDDIRANNDISGRTLNELLESRFGVSLKTSTLYKMRTLALKEINGGHDESYGYLPGYAEMVKQTNQGSVAICA